MENWNKIRFSKIARLTKGISYKSSDYCSQGEGAIFITLKCIAKAGGFSHRGIKYFKGDVPKNLLLKKGDLLFANTDLTRAGDIIGCPVYLPDLGNEFPITMSMDLSRVDFIEDNIDHSFVYYLMMTDTVRRLMRDNSSGSTVLHLKTSKVLDYFFIIPDNKPEQTRIAKILSKADAAIKETEALIDKYQLIKKGLMQDLLTKGIDEHGNIRSEQTHSFKTENGLRVPADWEVRELGIMCNKGGGSIQTGPFGSQLHAEDYKTEGVPIITVEHLIANRISHENLPLVGKTDYLRLNKYVLRTGDLVFSRVGSIDRCSITTKDENGWMFSGRCLRVTPGKYFDPYFLMYQLNHDIAKNFILANAVGSTMKCLNTTILSRTPVFQLALPEQKRIADRILHLEAFIQEITLNKKKLQLFKTGLMQDLLSGKVRVSNIEKN